MKSVLSYFKTLNFKIFSNHDGWIKGVLSYSRNGSKSGQSSWTKSTFFVYCWKLAHLIFLIFCIKLEGIKGYKLPQMPFLGNFLFCRFWPFLLIFGPKKINFLYNYCPKLNVFDILHKLDGIKWYTLPKIPGVNLRR